MLGAHVAEPAGKDKMTDPAYGEIKQRVYDYR